MQPRIEIIDKKLLVGNSQDMSLVNNKTFELFSSFMPNRNKISNAISSDVFEVMEYHDLYFKNFNPNTSFKKWATLEVTESKVIPESMQTLVIEKGLYAVFQYKGLPQGFGELMRYILSEWLPKSNYELDNRPHFNILGNKYKHDDPNSEEEVYIPIKNFK